MNAIIIKVLLGMSSLVLAVSGEFKELDSSTEYYRVTDRWREAADEVKMEIKIAGGSYIKDITQHPYMAAVFNGDEFLMATGVLITTKHVLTNAIEFMVSGKDVSAQKVTVRVGSSDAYRGYREYLVKWIYFHPFIHSSHSEIYDLAILQLKGHVRITSRISPIDYLANLYDLPPKSTEDLVRTRAECKYLGFGGRQKNYLQAAGYLREEKLQLIPWEMCQKHLNQTGRNWVVFPEYEICAEKAEKGGCFNEMGAPLICNDRLYGLMTDYDLECNGRSPTIFVRVDVHNTFINMPMDCPDKCIETPNYK